MFYVSGSKIYLATYDEDLKAYPECQIIRGTDGALTVKRKSSGVSIKPKNREVCSLKELLARFGHLADAPASTASNKK